MARFWSSSLVLLAVVVVDGAVDGDGVGQPGGFSRLFDAYRRMFSMDDAMAPVVVEVFGEALCPDTSRFLQEQLMPTWRKLKGTGSLIVKYHPFGVQSYCQKLADGLKCTCQHGDFECVLNQLQSCVISALQIPQLYLPVVACIQGKRSLSRAIGECIDQAQPQPELDSSFMARCAQSQLGKKLYIQHGFDQRELAPDLDWVPWVIIDGQREPAAEFDLLGSLCTRRVVASTQVCQDAQHI